MPANSVSGGRPSSREAVLDLVATWGAQADPAVAPLFAAIPRRFDITDLLALVREKSRDLLPASLRDEMDRASAVLQAGGTAQAPSFRARLADILDRAGEALEPALLTERSELATMLADRWQELEDGPIADTLTALWTSTEEPSVAGRVAGIERIRTAKAALRAAPAGAGRTPAGRTGAAAAGGGTSSAPQAKAAMERFAAVLAAAKQAAGTAPASENGGSIERRLLTALDRIQGGVLQTAAEPDTTSLLDLCETELLPDAVAQAERVRRRAEARAALVATLAAMASEVSNSGDTGSIAEGTRERAAAGGPPFYDALRTAAERLVAVRLKSAAALEASAATLRNAAKDLETTLPKIATHLPTQQVVESRLLLEQAAGVLQAGRRDEIEAHADAVRRRLEEARQLSDAQRATSKERGERDRQTLAAAIGSLSAVASRGAARRLARLEASLSGGGKGAAPDNIRQELDRIARAIEQEVRHSAALRLSAARAWLKGRDGAAAATDSPVAGLAAACDSLATSLAGDDLRAIRDRADGVRSLLWRASPLQRPAVRGAAAGVAAALAVGAVGGWLLFQNRARTVRLELPPESWQSVWMVRDGHLVQEMTRGGGKAAPEFRLPPGHYEIYVDHKYTGRRFSVPDETVVKDIVPTPSPASAGSTGAGDEPTADR